MHTLPMDLLIIANFFMFLYIINWLYKVHKAFNKAHQIALTQEGEIKKQIESLHKKVDELERKLSKIDSFLD